MGQFVDDIVAIGWLVYHRVSKKAEKQTHSVLLKDKQLQRLPQVSEIGQ